ncbi:MAG: type IX secretion system plug protein domain-containing protein, partial [Bacteroidota bacterium]
MLLKKGESAALYRPSVVVNGYVAATCATEYPDVLLLEDQQTNRPTDQQTNRPIYMLHCSKKLSLHLRAVALLLLFSLGLSAQEDEGLKFYDNTYVDNIKTVRLHIEGFPHSYPLIELGGNARLRLSFDDLSDEVRRYSYKFIHCDQDWQPSGLSPLEFNSGYSVDYLDEYDFSLRTLKEYVHYDLIFPNRNMKLE